MKLLFLQARLRDRHQDLLKRKLAFLKQQQLSGDRDEDSPLFPAGAGEGEGAAVKVKEEEEEEEEEGETVAGPSGTGEEPDTLIDEDDLLRRAYEDYESGGYSPKLLKFADVEEVGVLTSPLPFISHPSPSIGSSGRCQG